MKSTSARSSEDFTRQTLPEPRTPPAWDFPLQRNWPGAWGGTAEASLEKGIFSVDFLIPLVEEKPYNS